MNIKTNAEFFKKRRKELGLSQQKVAEHIGISTRSYIDFETGRSMMRANHMTKLFEILELDNVSMEELIEKGKEEIIIKDGDRIGTLKKLIEIENEIDKLTKLRKKLLESLK